MQADHPHRTNATKNLLSGGRISRRRTLRMAGAIAAAAVLPSPPLRGETRQEKARRLLEECREAIGGGAFMNLRNFVLAGRAYSFYHSDLRGLARMTIYEKYEELPAGPEPGWLPVSRREVYTEKGDYYSLFQNGKGWEVTFRGARPYPKDRMQRYRESTRRDIFYMLRYRFDEPGMYFYYKGTEIIDNAPTDAVQIVDADNETVTVFLGMSDRLPAQQLYTRRDPETRIPFEEKSVFSRYRSSGGVKLPWNRRHERDGEKVFELFGRSLEINQALDDGLFRLPGSIPILSEQP